MNYVPERLRLGLLRVLGQHRAYLGRIVVQIIVITSVPTTVLLVVLITVLTIIMLIKVLTVVLR